MTYLIEMKITSVHDNIVTWRKEPKVQNYTIIYPRDMSTPSISMMCPTITAESSTSFKASSSLYVAAKPSPTASKSAQGYKDFRMLRVKPVDCLILARIISRVPVKHLRSSCPRRGLVGVEECYYVVHHRLQGIKLSIRLYKPKRG
jgi:hypothetical protein